MDRHDNNYPLVAGGGNPDCPACARELNLQVLGYLDQSLAELESAARIVAGKARLGATETHDRKARALQRQFSALLQQVDRVALAVVDLGLTCPGDHAEAKARTSRLKLVSSSDDVSSWSAEPGKPPPLHVCGKVPQPFTRGRKRPHNG